MASLITSPVLAGAALVLASPAASGGEAAWRELRPSCEESLKDEAIIARHLSATPDGDGLVAMFVAANESGRTARQVVRLHAAGPGWDPPQRLVGCIEVRLEAGESRRMEIPVDPRLLARWYEARPGWTQIAGIYTLTLRAGAQDPGESVTIELPPAFLPPDWTAQERPGE